MFKHVKFFFEAPICKCDMIDFSWTIHWSSHKIEINCKKCKNSYMINGANLVAYVNFNKMI